MNDFLSLEWNFVYLLFQLKIIDRFQRVSQKWQNMSNILMSKKKLKRDLDLNEMLKIFILNSFCSVIVKLVCMFTLFCDSIPETNTTHLLWYFSQN